MHHMMMELITTWFRLMDQWGYIGVFFLMAMESSIIPLPSEVIIPPMAYHAAQGRYDMSLIVLVGAAGSLFGSLIMYGASMFVGQPFLMRYGKYIFLKPDKIDLAERFFLRYSTGGIFFSRLIPVVRHLISIPAGLSKMKIVPFSILTTVGAGLWCAILAWFGSQVIGGEPHLLDSPEMMGHVLAAKLRWFGVAAAVMLVLYVLVARMTKAKPAAA